MGWKSKKQETIEEVDLQNQKGQKIQISEGA